MVFGQCTSEETLRRAQQRPLLVERDREIAQGGVHEGIGHHRVRRSDVAVETPQLVRGASGHLAGASGDDDALRRLLCALERPGRERGEETDDGDALENEDMAEWRA